MLRGPIRVYFYLHSLVVKVDCPPQRVRELLHGKPGDVKVAGWTPWRTSGFGVSATSQLRGALQIAMWHVRACDRGG